MKNEKNVNDNSTNDQEKKPENINKREIWEFIKKLILFIALAIVSTCAPALQGIFINMFGMSIEVSQMSTAFIQSGVSLGFIHSNI